MNHYVTLFVILLLVLSGCAARPAVTVLSDIPATPLAAATTNNAQTPTRGALPPVETKVVVPPTDTARPATNTPLPPTASATTPPSATPVPPTETATPTPEPTFTPTSTATEAAAAATGGICAQPPDDYTRVEVRRGTISRRTYAMLENAQALYGGRGSMFLLIQGSYSTSTAASFGTHAGGGAVDIWTVDPDNRDVLLNDIDAMVLALRQAGFAAWFRPANSLYQGMFPHIHAIAIGDAELSQDAIAQLTGAEGYFRGRAGLPQPEFLAPDPHGGTVICDWMRAQGYGELPYGENAATPTATAPALAACLPPTEDYSRVTVEEQTINRRTHLMLEYAQQLYGGPGNLLWVTQGSYSDAVDASFGTHAGGGAVDISIRNPSTFVFMPDEAMKMVTALRQAGFAAWYRSPEEGFTPHIHAIAIGDAELSEAAREQIYGANGYFNGGNALPPERAAPDRHGGAIACDWMP